MKFQNLKELAFTNSAYIQPKRFSYEVMETRIFGTL